MYRWLLILFSILFLAAGFVLFTWSGVFGSVDPENIDRQTLIRVIQLRDFRKFSPDMIERLTDRAEQEFGRLSLNKPVFELPYWEKRTHVYFYSHRSNSQSHCETNMTMMAKVRYMQWMHDYNSAEPAQKATIMKEVVENMSYWQALYLEYVRFLGEPEPTPAEMFQDFTRMISRFKAESSPEEIVLIDSFAKKLCWTLFAAEMKKTIWNLFSPPK